MTTQTSEKSRLHQRYENDVVPALKRDFNYTNPMQVPRLSKVSVNVGVGEAITNSKALDATVRDVSIITGQKPIVK
jgi:large subunit ribosomal protein L5